MKRAGSQLVGPGVILTAALLAACASVPLGTMLQMSRMGPEDFLRIEPDEVRVAVQGEPVFIEEVDSGTLVFVLSWPDGRVDEWSMALVDAAMTGRSGLPEAPPNRAWRVLAMAEDSRPVLRDFQTRLAQWLEADTLKGSELSMTASAGGPGGNAQVGREAVESTQRQEAMQRWARDGLPMRIDLQLFAERGFFTLMKESRVPFEFEADPAE